MLSLRIALRYLFSKKSHNAVNVISIVSMIGVAVATAAIVCVLSVFNGFTDLSMSRLSRVTPPLRIVPLKGKTIADADSLAKAVASIDGVSAAFPAIDEQALAVYRSRQMPVRVIGLHDSARSVTDIHAITIDGEYNAEMPDSSLRPAALSIGVAARLNAHPGLFDWLTIYAPQRRGRINAANPMGAFVADSLVVTSVYEAQDGDFDASTIVVPLSTARYLFDYASEASSVDVAFDPRVSEPMIVDRISEAIGPAYQVLTRLRQQESSFRMIAVEKWITFSMLAFILIIASFNIISTLSMLIIEKRSNIATLRAMGATLSAVRRIFLLEGWLISMVGAVAGILLGLILTLAQQLGGFIKLSADPSQLTITTYPVRLIPSDLLIVFLLTAVVGYLVGAITTIFIKDKHT